MSDEFMFFNYLVEMYASYKNKTAGEVLREWTEHNIAEKIFNSYLYV